MTKKIRRFCLYVLLPCLALWITGLLCFAALVNKKPVDEKTKTEAIVALTGGTERLATAVELLKQGKAQKLLISGVDRKVDWLNLAQTIDELPPELNDKIVLGHVARNTTENALESLAWMKRNGFTSLRLVTASYHMPRSYSEFKNVMPDIKILPHPVFPQTFKHADWWKWRGSTALIVSEYTKFLFVSLRNLLPRRLPAFDSSEVLEK
mgnify:CR=1 FL=1